MCGISGAFRFAGDRPIDGAIIAAMGDDLRSRGPDGQGQWSSTGSLVVLGHRRLSVIDVSADGDQPMSDIAGRWTITFNGEIYNYLELRRELEKLGCRFRSRSDTEVVINAVACWGEAGLVKLQGMFAFALWDEKKRELWLARDPYGIKPLYFAVRDGLLWFASQAKTLAQRVPANAAVSSAAVVSFYQWGFVPEPITWWSSVRALSPGHVMRVRAGCPFPASVEFASVQDCYINRPLQQISREQLRLSLLESLRLHMVSDVPVGLFLSAGVDSTALAVRAFELGARVRTITLAFDEYRGTARDEAPLAEATARALKFDHTTVRITREQFDAQASDFFRAMDQPTTDGLNTYLISHAASSQGLKVMLSGLGGDELFGGYPSFRQLPKLLRWRKRIPAAEFAGPMIQNCLHALGSVFPPKLPGLWRMSGDLVSAYWLRRALNLDFELERMMDPQILKEGMEQLETRGALFRSIDRLVACEASDHAKIAALESSWYMRNQLLRDTDWASMAHSVEVRVPFASFPLLRSLGPAIASRKPPQKRDLLATIGKQETIRPQEMKTGFTTPVRQWARESFAVEGRGLRGWASFVDYQFRGLGTASSNASK